MNFDTFFKTKSRKILYFGASVTVQKNGYREKLHSIFLNESGLNHSQIINGIGGVGSMFCLGNVPNALRNPDDVDLVINECFTGDTNAGITSPEMLRIFLDNYFSVFPNSQHLFLLNYRADRSIAELEKVAEIYEEYSVKFNCKFIKIYSLIEDNYLLGYPLNEIYRDGVHLTDHGAEIIAQKIWSILKDAEVTDNKLIQNRKDLIINSLCVKFRSVHSLIDHIDSKYYLNKFTYQNTGQIFEYINLDVDFTISIGNSNLIGFLGLSGPESPSFVTFKSAAGQRKFKTFDRNSYYVRPQTYSWPSPLIADNVDIIFDANLPDFSECTKFNNDFSKPRCFKFCGIYVLE